MAAIFLKSKPAPEEFKSVGYLLKSIFTALVLVVVFTFTGFAAGLIYGFIYSEAQSGPAPSAFAGAFLGTNLSVPVAIVFLVWRSRRSKRLSFVAAVLLVALIAFWILAINDQIPNTFKPF